MKRLFHKSDNELVGHYIPYVVTTTGDSLTDKAFHPAEYMKSQHTEEKMKIDIEWYKKN